MNIPTLLIGLLGLAQARPDGPLFQRAACNRDNCLRQVVASSASPGNAKGSADCMSFMTTTVTPCPTTVTVTAPTSTSVSTTTVQDVSVFSTTTTSIVTSVSTSVYLTTTVATAATVTVQRRDAAPAPVLVCKPGKNCITDGLLALEKRTTAACSTGALTSSSAIPAYASSCHSAAQYSSACSCDGITAATTTLAPSTVTTTVTPTTLSVSTVTVVTIVSTFTSSALSTTDLVTTITSIATVTTTPTVTSTAATSTGAVTCPAQYVGIVSEQCDDGTICTLPVECFSASPDQCANNLCGADCVAYITEPDPSDSPGFCAIYDDCCTS